MLAAGNGPLPFGYKRVDYLQTSGYQARIDTGVNGNNAKLEFDLECAIITRSAYAAIFGNYTSEDTACWRLINTTGTGDTRLYHACTHVHRTNSSITINAVPTGESVVGTKIHFHISAGSVSAQCGDYTTTVTKDPDGAAPSTRNIAIGAPWPANNGTNASVNRLWSFRISDDDVLIRDYIPCVRLSDNLAGFWDAVNGTFNPSIGSVDFIAGMDE